MKRNKFTPGETVWRCHDCLMTWEGIVSSLDEKGRLEPTPLALELDHHVRVVGHNIGLMARTTRNTTPGKEPS